MKQKLIMENWRRFIKEENEKEVLEEGLLQNAFLGLALLAGSVLGNNASAADLVVDGDMMSQVEVDAGSDLGQKLIDKGSAEKIPGLEKATKLLDNIVDAEGNALGDVNFSGELSDVELVQAVQNLGVQVDSPQEAVDTIMLATKLVKKADTMKDQQPSPRDAVKAANQQLSQTNAPNIQKQFDK